MNIAQSHNQSNQKIPFLFLDSSKKPVIQLPNGEMLFVDNSKLGAWRLRTSVPHLDASAEAQEWFSANNPNSYTQIAHLVHNPVNYQILAFNRMLIGNCALWLDMGLGKSFVVLMYCLHRYLLSNKQDNIFLITCPVSVFHTWKQEILTHYDEKLDIDFILAHGSTKNNKLAKLKASNSNKLTFIVTSYDTLKIIRANLETINIKAIFFDEASEVKYLTAQKTKEAHALVYKKKAPTYLLSGTPSTTHVAGYFSLYELLQKGASGSPTLFHFKQTYEEQKKFYILEIPFPNGKMRQIHVYAENLMNWLAKHYPINSTISYLDLGYSISEQPKTCKELKLVRTYNKQVGVKNLDKLNEITKRWAYTVEKKEVLLDLPPKTLIRRMIELPTSYRKAYESMIDENKAEIETTAFSFQNLSSPFCKLHQIANGFLNNNGTITYFKEQPKIEELFRIIEESGSQKIVVWSPHLPQIALIKDRLTEAKINHVKITGSTPGAERIALIDTFWKDATCKVFLGNPAAAGMGVNLQIAYLEIFMANWYKPDVRIQAEDRLYRKGQENAVTVLDVVAKDTIEVKILNTLVRKIDLEKKILSMKDLRGEE